VRDKLDFVFEDRGEQQVKNIARPVRVFDVRTAVASEALMPGSPSGAPRQNRSPDSVQHVFGQRAPAVEA